jgi:hypothetical protein
MPVPDYGEAASLMCLAALLSGLWSRGSGPTEGGSTFPVGFWGHVQPRERTNARSLVCRHIRKSMRRSWRQV